MELSMQDREEADRDGKGQTTIRPPLNLFPLQISLRTLAIW